MLRMCLQKIKLEPDLKEIHRVRSESVCFVNLVRNLGSAGV